MQLYRAPKLIMHDLKSLRKLYKKGKNRGQLKYKKCNKKTDLNILV